MPSSASCRRCSQPLEVQSASGLCATCQIAADTSQSSVGSPALKPLDHAETVSFSPPDPAAATASAPPAALNTDRIRASDATADPETRSPLPPAPPGYDLFRRLGGGGMGEVYLAREHAAERTVAMKFLRGGPDGTDRFLVELRALAALDHPNIVRVFGHDFYRVNPYFTMEYASGGSLAKFVEEHGPLSPADAARLITTAARAVEQAHEKGVIHRDLKPSNILLQKDEGGGMKDEPKTESGSDSSFIPPPSSFQPKVSDFGLAKRLEHDDAVTIGTGPLGTPGYMPPEQISKKNGEVGRTSDVYGLGASLYHLLTGRPPFVGDTREEIITSVLSDPPTRPRAIRAELPLELEGIVVKCLEKDQRDRYPTAAALADDLDRFLAGRKPVAPPLTPLRRAVRWVGRHRWRVAVAAALVLGLTATAVALMPRDYRKEYRRELAAGRKVTLIGEKGEPRWHEWRLGATVFTPSPTGDGTCAFESVGFALLELLDDPGIDRYRIRADIRQVQARGAPTGGPPRDDEGTVGVYFSYSERSEPDRQAHAFFAVRFRDYDVDSPKTGVVNDQRAALDRALLVTTPDSLPRHIYSRWGAHPFRPVALRPGDWRTLEVEVTPERISAWWVVGDARFPIKTAQPPPDPANKYGPLQKDLTEHYPGTTIRIPAWSPRMPLGVFVHGSSVTVRNFTVAPLDSP